MNSMVLFLLGHLHAKQNSDCFHGCGMRYPESDCVQAAEERAVEARPRGWRVSRQKIKSGHVYIYILYIYICIYIYIYIY